MAQFGCPAGLVLDFIEDSIFDGDQFQKMSIMDKIRIRVWVGTAVTILTLIALCDDIQKKLKIPK